MTDEPECLKLAEILLPELLDVPVLFNGEGALKRMPPWQFDTDVAIEILPNNLKLETFLALAATDYVHHWVQRVHC